MALNTLHVFIITLLVDPCASARYEYPKNKNASSLMAFDFSLSSDVGSVTAQRAAARARGLVGITLLDLQEVDSDRRDDSSRLFSPAAETGLCCVLASFGAAALLAQGYRERHEQTEEKQEALVQNAKEHHYVLDNAKLLLIFLVVYGHFLYYSYVGEADDGRTWLSGSTAWVKWSFSAVRTFPVPMFCFISGILSQGNVTLARLQRFLQFLIVPVFIWILLAKGIVLGILTDPRPQMAIDAIKALVTFQSFEVRGYEWFLLMLVMWKSSVYLCWIHLKPSITLATSIVFSACLGYISLGVADNFAALLPFFTAGLVFPLDKALKSTAKVSNLTTIAIGVAMISWIFLQDTLFHDPLPDGYGSYECCAAGQVFKGADGLQKQLYWTRKVAKIILDLLLVTGIILFLTPRRELSLSFVGEHCLFPYLFHGVGLLWRERLIHAFPPPVITNDAGHAIVLLLHVPWAILLMTLFASSYWRMLFAWCFYPTWFDVFMLVGREKAVKEKDRGDAHA